MLIKLTYSAELQEVPGKIYENLKNVRALLEQVDEAIIASTNCLEHESAKSAEYLQIAQSLAENICVFLEDSKEILFGYSEISDRMNTTENGDT